MDRIRNLLSNHRRAERGNTIIEMVVTIAIYMAIAGALVYGTSVIENARKTSADQTTSTISESGVSNNFRSDIGSARAAQRNELGNSLALAKADGSCVVWTIAKSADGESSELTRSRAEGAAPTAPGSVLAQKIKSGGFSYDGKKVSLELEYSSGEDFSESAKLNLAGSDGGECW